MSPSVLAILTALAGVHELGEKEELPNIRKIVSTMPKQELVDAVMTLCERFSLSVAATRAQVELIAITEFGMHPHNVGKLNLPTLAGSLMGLSLPAVQENKCCETCAFRQGSAPNQSAPTVADVFEALVDGTDFFCHEGAGGDGGKPLRPCRGWAQVSWSAEAGA